MFCYSFLYMAALQFVVRSFACIPPSLPLYCTLYATLPPSLTLPAVHFSFLPLTSHLLRTSRHNAPLPPPSLLDLPIRSVPSPPAPNPLRINLPTVPLATNALISYIYAHSLTHTHPSHSSHFISHPDAPSLHLPLRPLPILPTHLPTSRLHMHDSHS